MGSRDLDVLAMLDNWARWCSRDSKLNDYCDCPTNWQMIQQVEYKNCHQTTEEKLQEALEHQEPDELGAARIERIVTGLNRPLCVAIRIHYVRMPERDRHGLGLTLDQWNERRARLATRRAGWYFSPAMYLEAVDQAISEIEAAL